MVSQLKVFASLGHERLMSLKISKIQALIISYLLKWFLLKLTFFWAIQKYFWHNCFLLRSNLVKRRSNSEGNFYSYSEKEFDLLSRNFSVQVRFLGNLLFACTLQVNHQLENWSISMRKLQFMILVFFWANNMLLVVESVNFEHSP